MKTKLPTGLVDFLLDKESVHQFTAEIQAEFGQMALHASSPEDRERYIAEYNHLNTLLVRLTTQAENQHKGA